MIHLGRSGSTASEPEWSVRCPPTFCATWLTAFVGRAKGDAKTIETHAAGR